MFDLFFQIVGFCPPYQFKQWAFVQWDCFCPVGLSPVGFCPSRILSLWAFVRSPLEDNGEGQAAILGNKKHDHCADCCCTVNGQAVDFFSISFFSKLLTCFTETKVSVYKRAFYLSYKHCQSRLFRSIFYYRNISIGRDRINGLKHGRSHFERGVIKNVNKKQVMTFTNYFLRIIAFS